MNDEIHAKLEIVARHGSLLRDRWHLEWPPVAEQTAGRLHLDTAGDLAPTVAAIVGGASSGKSTVFNNLLDGHLASRVTARGHATRGPILAVHEAHRNRVEQLLEAELLFPGFKPNILELDADEAGESGALAMVFHTIDALENVLLLDTPDFTSDAAQKEGDVTLNLMPWFDRLLVVVDHERWFDRQSISKLRAESVRFGQQRLVLFNRTRETAIEEADLDTLRTQAERLRAERMVLLEFRRGRGFRVFPPGTLDGAVGFLSDGRLDRTGALTAHVAQAANRALGQNDERRARLSELRSLIDAGLEPAVPPTHECMRSLMTASERKQLEFVARVLGVHDARRWLAVRKQRIHNALRRMPVLGAALPFPPTPAPDLEHRVDRASIACAHYEAAARKHINALNGITSSSSFWSELRGWTGLKPTALTFVWTDAEAQQVRLAAGRFDDALSRWHEKVESQCRGINPHIHGAIGGGGVALAVILIAAPGPIGALTLVSVKAAIAASLTKLAAAAGAGAALGKQVGRLTALIQEKLLSSPEFEALQAATDSYRNLIERACRLRRANALTDAAQLVMDEKEPLAIALEVLSEAGTDSEARHHAP